MTTPPKKQRVALVTGSGKKRVGWEIAHTLAERGYDLAIHYRTSVGDAQDSVAEFRRQGVNAEAFPADLSNDAEVSGLVQSVLDRYGRLDALVNCAAIYEPKRFEDVTAADVHRHIDINLVGTFLAAQKAGLAMVKQRDGGSIINFGDWALCRPYCDYSAYFASKGAIPELTRCLAVELGSRNPRVRVNAILPGPVLFPATMPESEQRAAERATLVQRRGQPQDIAGAVLFLLENDFVTGVSLPVDGGRTIYAREE